MDATNIKTPKQLLSELVILHGRSQKNCEKIRKVFRLFLLPLRPLIEDHKHAKRAYKEIFRSVRGDEFCRCQCFLLADLAMKIADEYFAFHKKIAKAEKSSTLKGLALIEAECQRDALMALHNAAYLVSLSYSKYWSAKWNFSKKERKDDIVQAVDRFMQIAISAPIRVKKRKYSEEARESYFASFDKIKACL